MNPLSNPAQANWPAVVNENFDALPNQVYAYDYLTSTGLTWGYFGGRWGGFAVAAGTLALTNTADNYIVVLRSSGAISVSTSTTNWNDTTAYARVFKVTTAGGAVTAVEDHRSGPSGVHGNAAAGSALLAANNLSDVASAATARTNLGVDSAIAAAIAAIGLSGFRYTFSTTTTASDPGSGTLRLNHATPASATAVYLDDVTADGVDLSTLLASLGSSGLLKITSVADVGEWRVLKWTALPTDNTGWWTFTVVDQAGTGTFENGDELQLIPLQLAASGASIAGSTGSTDNALLRADGTGGATVQATGILVGDDNEISGYRAHINNQSGTTYELVPGDMGKIVECANGSAIAVTLPNDMPKGFHCTVVQAGAGQITFAAEGGGTASMVNRQSHTKSAGANAICVLFVRSRSGTDAVWVLGGDTAS